LTYRPQRTATEDLELKLHAKGTGRGTRDWLFFAAVLLTFVSALSGCRKQASPVLTLSVAASLQESITEAEAEYQREHGPVEFRNNFGASGTLAREIENGAPVDAFIAAGEKPMTQLETEGMLEAGTRVNLLRNSLVLIAPHSSDLQGFDQLGDSRVRLIALGDPASVPAGQYGKQTLESLHVYDKVKGKIVLGKDVRQVLTYVETGNADAGLVYATDAQTSQQVRVVAAAPEESHDPIVYPLAQIKGSHNADAVRSFIAFLRSPGARAIFERHGFHLA
jgi:molybdate transport system substrate-binding protein